MIWYGIALTCSRGKRLARNYGIQVQTRNQVFCCFSKFVSLVFIDIAFSDSLQKCLSTSRGKIYEKKNCSQIWSRGVKVGQNQMFFAIFSSLVHFFSYSNSLQQHLTTSRGRIYEKNFGPKFGPQVLVPKLGFLPFSQLCFVSFPSSCIQWQLALMSNMQQR